jgi:hypothetical protein
VIRASAAQRIAVEPIELPLKEEKKYPPKPVTWPAEIDGFLIELLPGILFEAVTGGRCHRRIIHFRGIFFVRSGPVRRSWTPSARPTMGPFDEFDLIELFFLLFSGCH